MDEALHIANPSRAIKASLTYTPVDVSGSPAVECLPGSTTEVDDDTLPLRETKLSARANLKYIAREAWTISHHWAADAQGGRAVQELVAMLLPPDRQRHSDHAHRVLANQAQGHGRGSRRCRKRSIRRRGKH